MERLKLQGVNSIAPTTALSKEFPRQPVTRLKSRAEIQKALKKLEGPGKRKIAATEATQCTHRDENGMRCAYEFIDPKKKKCQLHADD